MSIKYIFAIVFCLGINNLFATHPPISTKDKKKVILTAEILNCSNELGLYQFDGVGFKLLESVKAKTNEPFVFEISVKETTVLYVGKPKQQKRPLVLGPEEKVHIKGSCNSIRRSVIVESEWNKQYDEVIKTIQDQKRLQQQTMRLLQRSPNNVAVRKNVETQLNNQCRDKNNFIDSMMTANPFLGKLAAINSYSSFLIDKGNHKNELDHYGYDFFADVALEDSDYDHLTFLFEAFREYASTLARTNAPKEKLNSYVDHSLKRINSDRSAYKIALGGIVLGLQSSQHPSYLHYGEMFVEKYKDEKAEYIQALAQQLIGTKALLSGGVAPDFSADTPEGESLRLSDLRGNYLLIDFWASWCGPCRKENPKVVKLYNKYHEKGFDILGVSLDNNKDKWVGAIEKDGLMWNHISDLKGWQSGPAGLYGVRSIPSTVLLDKDGKIVARNLRAHQLEEKLKEIFGE